MTQWKISNPLFQSDQINANLKYGPWQGHRRFAYDFINFMRPSNAVELGTHYGCSFFSFCQSVKDFNLATSLYAIDTWLGDEHAGFYDEHVYKIVCKTVDEFFQDIDVTLLRKTFDQALDGFEDNSIELIHIDALHTYEAVTHDFQTWLPKLKHNGVVMFHDVFSYADHEYGTNRFWKEIKRNYPYYEFKHSWGLGLLFPKGDDIYKKLLHENMADKVLYYTNKSLYEFEKIRMNQLEVTVNERDKEINNNEKLIREKDEMIRKIEEQLTVLQEKYLFLEAKENKWLDIIGEKDKEIEQKNQMIHYYQNKKIILNFQKKRKG